MLRAHSYIGLAAPGILQYSAGCLMAQVDQRAWQKSTYRHLANNSHVIPSLNACKTTPLSPNPHPINSTLPGTTSLGGTTARAASPAASRMSNASHAVPAASQGPLASSLATNRMLRAVQVQRSALSGASSQQRALRRSGASVNGPTVGGAASTAAGGGGLERVSSSEASDTGAVEQPTGERRGLNLSTYSILLSVLIR